jgi:CRISPR-associated protein Cmr3
VKLALTPIDTWFFRDGTPYDKDASPQAGVAGVFPPYPPTVAGAIRAALALHNGWDGRARWSRDIEAVLGDGPDNLGRLRITGPFVLHRGVPVVPMPRHVLGRSDEVGRWLPEGMLRPGASGVQSDLGAMIRLPEIAPGFDDTASLVPVPGHWVTGAGLGRILRGEVPGSADVVRQDDLWVEELRVGITRDASSRTVKENALYSARHVRLRASVSIGVEVDGVPTGWRTPAGSVLALGGESRIAECDHWRTSVAVDLDVPVGEARTIVLVALTPVLLGQGAACGRLELPIRGVRIVSACADRPLRIGGWDSLRRAPLPLKNALAPGSTLFCEVEHVDELRKELRGGLLRIGASTSAGFGLCAVGNAPAWERRTT